MRSKRKNKVSKGRLRQSKVRKTSLRKSKRTQRKKSKKYSRKTRRSFIKKSRKNNRKLKGGAQASDNQVLEKLVGTWKVELKGWGKLIGGMEGNKIQSVGAGMSVHMEQPYRADEESTEEFTIVKYHPSWMNSPIYRGEGTSGGGGFDLGDIKVEKEGKIVMTQLYSDDMPTRWEFTISADGKNLEDGSLSVINFDDTEQKFGIFTAQKIETATSHASQLSQSTEHIIFLTVRDMGGAGRVPFYGELSINTTISELKEVIKKRDPQFRNRQFNLYKTKEKWWPALYGWKLERTTPLVDEGETLEAYGISTGSTIEIEIVQPQTSGAGDATKKIGLDLGFMVD